MGELSRVSLSHPGPRHKSQPIPEVLSLAFLGSELVTKPLFREHHGEEMLGFGVKGGGGGEILKALLMRLFGSVYIGTRYESYKAYSDGSQCISPLDHESCHRPRCNGCRPHCPDGHLRRIDRSLSEKHFHGDVHADRRRRLVEHGAGLHLER